MTHADTRQKLRAMRVLLLGLTLVVLVSDTAAVQADAYDDSLYSKILYVRTECRNSSERVNSSVCCSLHDALLRVQEFKRSIQVIFLETDNVLRAHSESNILIGLANVSFNGSLASPALIRCEEGAGLAFINSTNVALQSIIFNNCGTNRTKSAPYDPSVKEWPSALLFQSSGGLLLRDVILYQSRGTGIIMINPFGRVIITGNKSIFSQNSFDKTHYPDYPGGGGMLLYFDGTDHEAAKENSSALFHSNITLDHCSFTANSVKGTGEGLLKPAGGAMAIVFDQDSAYNYIYVNEIYFNGNTALHGAGILIRMQGESNNNMVMARKLNFFGHQCYNENKGVKLSPLCIGGALSFQFLFHPESMRAANNSVYITRSLISKNVAFAGGAISVVANRQTARIAETNSLVISHSRLTFNRAQVGSAIHFSSNQGSSEGYLIKPVIEVLDVNSNFITNKSNVTVGQGALYVNQIPVQFRMSNNVHGCQGTALVVAGAQISVLPNSSLIFKLNQGNLGGALALLNGASLIIHEGTELHFEQNKANEKGGAIYISNYYDTYEYPMSEQQCAISYYNRSTPPSNWKTKFYFRDNYAGLERSAIFATSVLSCPTEMIQGEVMPPFLWVNWEYGNKNTENTDHTYVQTSPANIKTKLTSSHDAVRTIPGFPFTLPLRLIDDYEHDVTKKSVVLAFSADGKATVDLSSQYIAGGNVTIYGQPNTTATLAVETVEPRVIYTELQLFFEQCPPGFYVKQCGQPNRYTCTCDSGFHPPHVIFCNRESLSAKIFYKWCMTYDKQLMTIVVAPWIYYSQFYFIHRQANGYLQLPRSPEKLEHFFCEPLNRTGRLCGQCQNNTGVSVSLFDFMCVSCNKGDFSWHFILYLVVELVPVTIFFLIVVFFNISITTGPATSFVYYSQIITMPIEIFHFQDIFKRALGQRGKILLNIFIIPYSIWNLDFFRTIIPSFCLHPSLKTMHVMAMSYVGALYPLFLVIACYLFIELYARGVRGIVCICRPFSILLGRFRRNWQIRTSVIDAFATFLVLAYTKLCSTSFFLLVPNNIYNATGMVQGLRLLYMDASVEYASAEHLWLMIFAICVVILIVISLPLILFIYPLKHVQKFLNRYHLRGNNLVAFMDSFQGCFKDGTNGTKDLRSFSAVYFFFRIIILAISITSYNQVIERILQLICALTLILLLVLFHPYKNNAYNNLDVFTMLLLAYISAYGIAHANTVWDNKYFTILFFVVLPIPMVYMTLYTGYHILKKCKQNQSKLMNYSTSFSPISHTPERNNYDSFPDRLLHPENYGDHFDSRTNEQVSLLNKAVY